MIRIVALLIATFAVAGIPFGYLIGRAGGVDVRRQGSGNIGATNVLRSRGRAAAALTLLLDVAKGALPVAAARWLEPQRLWVALAAAFIAVAGHCFTPYLRFRGGKGVATGLGAFLVLQPLAALASLLLFVGTFLFTRIVAAASAGAAIGYPAFAWLLGSPAVALGSLPPVAVILWRHRENFRRMRAGSEGKIRGGRP